jgi:hypothetical protein
MRTTLRLNDALLRRVKQKALEQGKTFTDVVQEALASWVQGGPAKPAGRRVVLPKSGKGGLLPGIDLSDNASVLDRMDGPG